MCVLTQDIGLAWECSLVVFVVVVGAGVPLFLQVYW